MLPATLNKRASVGRKQLRRWHNFANAKRFCLGRTVDINRHTVLKRGCSPEQMHLRRTRFQWCVSHCNAFSAWGKKTCRSNCVLSFSLAQPYSEDTSRIRTYVTTLTTSRLSVLIQSATPCSTTRSTCRITLPKFIRRTRSHLLEACGLMHLTAAAAIPLGWFL